MVNHKVQGENAVDVQRLLAGSAHLEELTAAFPAGDNQLNLLNVIGPTAPVDAQRGRERGLVVDVTSRGWRVTVQESWLIGIDDVVEVYVRLDVPRSLELMTAVKAAKTAVVAALIGA